MTVYLGDTCERHCFCKPAWESENWVTRRCCHCGATKPLPRAGVDPDAAVRTPGHYAGSLEKSMKGEE